MRALLVLASLVLAGCLEAPAEPAAPAETPDVGATRPAATVVEWTGRVLDSRGEALLHVRPTEDVLWPVEQEGFLFDIAKAPRELEVALEWSGPGEFMIMLHSHKEHGTNAYAEHITPLDGENPKCLRVPAADIVEGVWQIMVHSRNAHMTTIDLKILLVDGEGAIVPDERHGHWLQDGDFEVEEREIEPCSLYGAADPAA